MSDAFPRGIGKITFDPGELSKRIKAFSAKYGVELGTVLRTQMALWSLDLVNKTFPRSAGNSKTGLGSGRGGIAAGKRAVKVGIDNCIRVFGEDSGKIQTADMVYDATWLKDGRRYFRRGGRPKQVLWSIKAEAALNGNLASVRSFHQSRRNRNDGRVNKHGQQMYTDRKVKSSYLREVQQHVGRTKAGWSYGADYFLAKADPALVQGTMPDWVTRHRGWAHGKGYSMRLDELPMHVDPLVTTKGSMGVGNNVPWVKDEGMMAASQRTRQRDLELWMWKRMEKTRKATEVMT